MQRLFIFVFSFSFLFAEAQTFQEVTIGTGYQQQSFIDISAGTEAQIANDSWDIAFTIAGQQDAGIFINESGGFSMGMELSRIFLYDAGTTDFDAVLDPATLVDAELLNDERSWSYGAFNATRMPGNFLDFGWGQYNPGAMQVTGDKVFVLKLRDGSYKKIQIQSLVGLTYNFRYANLDGSDLQTKSITKSDYPGKTLAYFSFATNTAVDVEPNIDFDLIYARFVTLALDINSQNYQQYLVTGFLQGPGTTIAKVVNIDPATVTFDGNRDTLKTVLNTIGHDWKVFTGTAWMIESDRVYFVKTKDDNLWKLKFIDFEGSSTGVTVFEKTDLGEFVSVKSPQELGLKTLLFPNPVENQLNISLDAPAGLDSDAVLQVLDMNGRLVLDNAINIQSGVQVLQVPATNWNAGLYQVRLLTKNAEIKLGNVVKL